METITNFLIADHDINMLLPSTEWSTNIIDIRGYSATEFNQALESL